MSLHAAEIQNDMLPSLPPQLYIYYGNNINEAQMQSLEFALINSKVNPNGGEFLHDSRLILNEVGVGVADYVVPHTTNESSSSWTAKRVGYPPHSVVENCFTSSQICDSAQPEFSLLNSSQMLAVTPPVSANNLINNVKRKQPMEEDSSKSTVANNDAILRIKRRNNADNGTRNNQSCCILESESDYSSKVPAVKRSQKLGDKITILQKLVSPYGKTDTASVLQEAEIHIKHLHTKIANMYELLTSSHINAATITQLDAFGGVRTIPLDLRQRGLCVMPVSVTRDLSGNNGTMDRGCLAARIMGNNLPTNIFRH